MAFFQKITDPVEDTIQFARLDKVHPLPRCIRIIVIGDIRTSECYTSKLESWSPWRTMRFATAFAILPGRPFTITCTFDLPPV
jgi:hypothetical protein